MAVLPASGLLRRAVPDGAVLSRALGWWRGYMPTGVASGMLLAAASQAWLGWRITWGCLGLLAWVCVLLIGRSVQSDGQPRSAAGAWPVALQQAASGLRATLSAPGPWAVAVAFGVYSGQWLAVVGFLPTVYAQAGWAAPAAALASAAAAGVNLVGNVWAGRLLARGLAPRVLLCSGYGAMALGAVGTFTLTDVAAYAAVLVFSACGGLVPGTLFALAVRVAPAPTLVSTTVGWVQQLSSFGQFVGPPLVGALAARVGGWQWTWVFSAVCGVCGAVLAMDLQRRWAWGGVAGVRRPPLRGGT